MKLKKIFITPIRGYQYISRMLPANCRYYPTCSEYAKWQFEFNSAHKALLHTTARILRCNQLFAGGIDYPVVVYTPPKGWLLRNPNGFYGKMKLIYWLVPKESTYYYVIKDFDGTYTPNTT